MDKCIILKVYSMKWNNIIWKVAKQKLTIINVWLKTQLIVFYLFTSGKIKLTFFSCFFDSQKKVFVL